MPGICQALARVLAKYAAPKRPVKLITLFTKDVYFNTLLMIVMPIIHITRTISRGVVPRSSLAKGKYDCQLKLTPINLKKSLISPNHT